MTLISKIKNRTAKISVIGLGYVGLPLATEFALNGFDVTGIDNDESRLCNIKKGHLDIQKIDSEQLIRLINKENQPINNDIGSLSVTSSYSGLKESDISIICVPTPLSKTRDPDLSYVVSATKEIAKNINHNSLVVLESTTYPGTTEEVILPILSTREQNQQEVGKDFFLAFSPERLEPGNHIWNIRNTPKIVGGITQNCLAIVTELYKNVVDTVVPVSSSKVAEMAKLLENTFRATNIALVNEIALMCDRLNIDVWETIDAAKTKPFGFMPFYPGPGLGGHCIPVDPHYLSWKLKTLNYNARFIELATEINLGMPNHIVLKVAESLNLKKKSINGSSILILGVAYKANVSDIRESPSIDIIELLSKKGADVSFNDPHVESIEIDGEIYKSLEFTELILSNFDCVIIATDHDKYDWDLIVDNSQLLIDTRNATKYTAPNNRVIKI